MESTDDRLFNIIAGLLISLAIGFFLLLMSFTIIGVGEVGVVTRLGNVNRELGSGIHMRIPWPFERIHKFDVKIQKDEAKVAAASSDLQDVNATIALNYSLERGSVDDVFKNIGTEYKERIIDPSVQESFKAVSAQYPISELISKRGEVKDKVRDALKERLGKNGILVTDVSIVNLEFSKEFTAAIEQKQVAEQKVQEANFALERVRKEAEAQRVQKETLTPEILQQQAINKWNGVMPTYLGGGSVFNIPLAK